MEAFAAELILVPVLQPLGDAMGFDPIHFGIIVIIMFDPRSDDSTCWHAVIHHVQSRQN